jgi:hypothetical protein
VNGSVVRKDQFRSELPRGKLTARDIVRGRGTPVGDPTPADVAQLKAVHTRARFGGLNGRNLAPTPGCDLPEPTWCHSGLGRYVESNYTLFYSLTVSG